MKLFVITLFLRNNPKILKNYFLKLHFVKKFEMGSFFLVPECEKSKKIAKATFPAQILHGNNLIVMINSFVSHGFIIFEFSRAILMIQKRRENSNH